MISVVFTSYRNSRPKLARNKKIKINSQSEDYAIGPGVVQTSGEVQLGGVHNAIVRLWKFHTVKSILKVKHILKWVRMAARVL